MADYFTLLTDTGRFKIASATANNSTVSITHFAVGDGNGQAVNPVPSQTALIHEVWRTQVESVEIDPNNPAAVIVKAIIPHEAGGWWMREIGIFDHTNAMIAVVKCLPEFKPTAAQGQMEDILYEFQLVIGEQANVVLLVNPSVMWATREYVETRRIPAWQMMNRPWIAIAGMSVTTPPANSAVGATYLIPAGATGAWAGRTGQLAEWNGKKWHFITPRDGHGIGHPTGDVYVREGGQYKLLRTLYQNVFDNRYSRLTTPPVSIFYVNGASGNDAHDGMSPQWAFKTIQGAINKIASKYLTFATVTLSVAPGEYQGITIPVSLVQDWAFIGSSSNPAATVIKAQTLDVNRGRAVTSRGNHVYFEGFEFKSAYENFSINDATTTSIRNCHLNIPTIANTFTVGAWGSRVNLHGTITVKGNGSSVVFIANAGGSIIMGYVDAAGADPCHIFYDNVVTTTNFAAERGGSISFFSSVVSFSGNLTAKKFSVSFNGTLSTAGAGTNWLPGDQEGLVGTGGQVA